MRKVILFFMLFFVCPDFFPLQAIDVKKNISEIPLDDRKKIEYLFRHLFKNLHLGYVVFGQKKAIAWDRFNVDINLESIFETKLQACCWTDHLWTTWEKYAHKFPSSKFILKRVLHNSSETPLVYEYLLINIPHCKKIIENHKSLFGNPISAIEIIQQIQSRGLLMLKDDLKIGLLLGYDIENAAHFNKQTLLLQSLAQDNPIPSKCPTMSFIDRMNIQNLKSVKHKKPNGLFPKTLIEYQRVQNEMSVIFSDLCTTNPLSPVPFPSYSVNPSHATAYDLMRSYQHERQKLVNIFQQSNFLEIVLECLCNST